MVVGTEYKGQVMTVGAPGQQKPPRRSSRPPAKSFVEKAIDPSSPDSNKMKTVSGHLEYENSDHFDEDEGHDVESPLSPPPESSLRAGGYSHQHSPHHDLYPPREISTQKRAGDTRGDWHAVAGSEDAQSQTALTGQYHELLWLFICFLGIMASFVCYGLLLEYTTSGGRKLHELSFLFVTSMLYTLTAAAGRYVRDETPTTIPPARFAVLGMTSMGSTFCSVRSLRYVIFPIQVLAKSCKPVPVMLMGTIMGKRYPLRKYVNVIMIVLGVALFMGGGNTKAKGEGDSAAEVVGGAEEDSSSSSPNQIIGILLLFASLCFDGGTGAYEDKLMSVHSVQPFDLMFNIQLGKTMLAGIGLLVLNQFHVFIQMIQEMGFLLIALGLTGAIGQVFIFVTIAKFGALTCSIIGLARKVTTLVASIYFYGHHLNTTQFIGLVTSVTAMVMNFWGKKKGGGGHGHGHVAGNGGDHAPLAPSDEMAKMLAEEEEEHGELEIDQQKPNY